MTTKYAGYGNEKLVPLGDAGDKAAVAELLSRGNYLSDKYPGKACRDVKAHTVLNKNQITAMEITPDTIVVVVNGKVHLK